MESSLYIWGMRWVVPRVRFWFPPVLPEWKIRRGMSKVMRGDILLTIDRWKLTSICIPGGLKHAAVYLGWGETIEMICSGYNETDFPAVCRANRVVIVRPLPAWPQEYLDQFIDNIRSFKWTPYDRQFKPDPSAVCCSEIVVHADSEGRLNATPTDLLGIGRMCVTPMDLFESNVEGIWDSDDPLLTPEGNET
jgi:hypothetical protein